MSLAIYLINNKKNYKYFTFFILLNCWLFIAAIKQLFSSNYYGDIDDVRYYDFIRLILTISSIYFCTLFLVLRLGLIKASKLLLLIIIFFVIFSFMIIFNYYFNRQNVNFYGLIINIDSGYLIWHWGTIIGLVGVLIPLFHFNIKSNTKLSSILFLIFISISCFILEGRTLLVFFIVYLLYITRNLVKKNPLLIIPGTLFFIMYLFFINNINDSLEYNLVSRLLNTFNFDNIKNEGRVVLFTDFFDGVNYYNIFGTLNTAAKYTNEGLESFHNIFLDSFWYAGYIGIITIFISFIYFIYIIYKIRGIFLKFIGLFILVGLIFGAPPFSEIIALNILLPFYLNMYFNQINLESSSKIFE